jgi:hypothetical protein
VTVAVASVDTVPAVAVNTAVVAPAKTGTVPGTVRAA